MTSTIRKLVNTNGLNDALWLIFKLVASLTTTSYQGNALNLTAQEGSGESEPRNFITDLSVHDYSDNTIDSGRVEKVNVEETAIESTQTSAIENATSGSADESKCSQSTTPSNTVGLDLELAQHEKKCSEDKECAYEIQTGGAFVSAIDNNATQPTALRNRISDVNQSKRKRLDKDTRDSVGVASRIFKVPRSTIQSRITRAAPKKLPHGGQNKVLSIAQTEALKKWILEQYYLGLGANRHMVYSAVCHLQSPLPPPS
ncbi:hypothetical protein VE00_10167 [Pseudogymnoascus sp. WSF 3629]|nr:hypothetical protein VE00_10167 [Pseudogymnoascus sp. WSF 3629]